MERLTKATDDLTFLCDHLRRETKFDAQRVKDIHDRLAAYEDTGMEPKEITSAIADAAKLISTMRNNKKAALWLNKYGARFSAEAAMEERLDGKT